MTLLVFYEAFHSCMKYLSLLLTILSGLKINLSKSELILVGRVESLEELALENSLKGCCGLGEWAASCCSGTLLGAPHNSLVGLDGVEERCPR